MSASAPAQQAVSRLREALDKDRFTPASVCETSQIILPFLGFFLLLTMEKCLAPGLHGSRTGGPLFFWGFRHHGT